MKSFVRGVQDLALLLVRLAAAFLLLEHGWHRYHTVGISALVLHLRHGGVPAPDVFAWGSIVFELFGAFFLVFGLLTPLVGLGMLAENVLTIAWLKPHAGYLVTTGGWELNLLLACLGLVFLAFGAGRLALDRLFRRGRDEPSQRFIDESTPA